MSGYGLIGTGEAYRDQGMRELGEANQLEQSRNIANKTNAAATKQSNAAAGAGLGAYAGSAIGGAASGASSGSWGGPIGMVIGAIAGGMLGNSY